MLSLPVLREADLYFMIALGVIAYIGIIWIVLKTFQYNKTKD